MASLRSALRLAPRASYVRPTATSRFLPVVQRSHASGLIKRADEPVIVEASGYAAPGEDDPNMNGNYPDPNEISALPVKRQHRDPYGPWWDPQERRNYGEPIHEDNDIMGIFSTEDYRHFTPAWGGVLSAVFVGTVGLLCGTVYMYYPDKPSSPRTFPGGLEAELGGKAAPRAKITENDTEALPGR
ncbi:Hypothetical protein R9X50_00345700 [Acrodontium crateriforme]|uniref:Uncharacterized protein n=1 Tax=Acrodontium crateriforme TaxID=150365 RepID=A0AAQ3M2K5_9PEZI|nr:Hypothetical protein R9X50_00345700 [Acrodontium crateriforme]